MPHHVIQVLRNHLFRAVDLEIEAVAKGLSERSARSLLKGSDLAIDTFDNSASRQLVRDHCRASSLPCLHAGG